jgi:hypothetical protein
MMVAFCRIFLDCVLLYNNFNEVSIKTTRTNKMNLLPNDAIGHISLFVSNPTLLNTLLTNTENYHLLNSESIWELRLKSHFPDNNNNNNYQSSSNSWKELFRDCCSYRFCPVYKAKCIQLKNDNRTAENTGGNFSYVRLDRPIPKRDVVTRISIRPEYLESSEGSYSVGWTLIGLASSFACDAWRKNTDQNITDGWTPGGYIGEMESCTGDLSLQNYGYADNGYMCSQKHKTWQKVFVYGTSFGIEVNLMAPCPDKKSEEHTVDIEQSGLGYLRFFNNGQYVGPIFYNIYQPSLEKKDEPYELYIVCNLLSGIRLHMSKESQVPTDTE